MPQLSENADGDYLSRADSTVDYSLFLDKSPEIRPLGYLWD